MRVGIRPIVVIALLALAAPATAGEVEILHAKLERASDGRWRIHVTLRHADTGWEHYADAWRVVGEAGAVLGTRTLYHPHVDEQPFTRSLSDVAIPPEAGIVYVEAHDKMHGWSPRRLEVRLGEAAGEGFEVAR